METDIAETREREKRLLQIEVERYKRLKHAFSPKSPSADASDRSREVAY